MDAREASRRDKFKFQSSMSAMRRRVVESVGAVREILQSRSEVVMDSSAHVTRCSIDAPRPAGPPEIEKPA
jgi:hypothetical protein